MKNRLFVAVLAVSSIVAAVSCGNVPEEKHTSFETLTLEPQDLEVPSTYSVAIAGRNDVSIHPQISGQLVKVCVIQGQKVKKGEVLFKIDDRKARQALNAANADYQAAVAQCNSAQLEYESNKNLFEKKIVSSYMLNTSLNDFRRAEAAVAQAQAAVADAKLNLNFCSVVTPVDGVVGNIPNNAGDVVSELTLLTVVSGNSEMKATFSVPENVLNEAMEERDENSSERMIDQLPEVTLILKDGTEYKHKGKVASISGVVDKTTGSVTCDVFFPNPDGFLFSGIQGTIRMMFPYEDILVAPLSAVVRVQDKAYVYRVKDNCAESVIVTIADLGNGKDVALLDGVSAGDVIVAKGASNVYDGMQVIFPEGNKESKK